MKIVKTLKIVYKDKPFSIKVYKTTSPSNYNLFVSIFRPDENMPLVGKTFRHDATNNQIKEWAQDTLKWPEMQCYVIG